MYGGYGIGDRINCTAIWTGIDPPRRNSLLRHLPSNAQKFITTTHLDWMESSPITPLPVFEVNDQKVKLRA